MTAVKRGVPLGALDLHVFLAGVPVDPAVITYTLTRPDGSVGHDEDGTETSDRPGLRRDTGVYHAGNTVLPIDAVTGTWTVTWSVKKLPTSPVATQAGTFEVLAKDAVDPRTEHRSRRDAPDTENLTALRRRLKDDAADDTRWAFWNSELQRLLDDAIAVHTEGRSTEATATADDLSLAMLLAHADGLHALATDRSRFFRWVDGNESVDKTTQPRSLTEIARGVMTKYQTIRQLRVDRQTAGVARASSGGLLEFGRR